MNALVLLAHGSRDPLAAQPLAQIRAWVQAARPDLDVRDAYLSLNAPTLDACLESLHHAGCRQATVLPMLVSRGHHLNVELPVLLQDLQARFPALRLDVSPQLGADDGIVGLILRRAAQAVPAVPSILL